MGTERSRIDYHPIYALERRLADARSLGGLTEISVEELECLLLHLKPVLEENERLQRDRERYQWLADDVLACDFGDNDSGQIGWRIRADVRCGKPIMFGPSINAAIDNAIAMETRGAETTGSVAKP